MVLGRDRVTGVEPEEWDPCYYIQDPSEDQPLPPWEDKVTGAGSVPGSGPAPELPTWEP